MDWGLDSGISFNDYRNAENTQTIVFIVFGSIGLPFSFPTLIIWCYCFLIARKKKLERKSILSVIFCMIFSILQDVFAIMTYAIYLKYIDGNKQAADTTWMDYNSDIRAIRV